MAQNYQSPKVLRMKNVNRAKGDCTAGSGDDNDCFKSGNSAGIVCANAGNNPLGGCFEPGNGV